jgi:prepilin-type N-terminal cleavage/methylation domain-containing protein
MISNKHIHRKPSESGFTLVELAIVLVIIGLIVGGVLVGQDLIKSAQIRATVGDIEKFNTGATAFQTKYSGLPGDLLNTRATSFGFVTRSGADGRGDGDAIIECGPGPATTEKTGLGHETALFWRDLSEAEFIPLGFATATDAAVATTGATIGQFIPSLRLRETGFITVYNEGGRNYFYVGGFGVVTVTTGAWTAPTDVLTPSEAESIDRKIDDGRPTTGVVRAVTALGAAASTADVGVAAPAAGDCANQGAGAPVAGDETYALAAATANAVGCQVRIRSNF